MATCGNCKQQGQTVEHIKYCFAEKHGTTLLATEEKPAVEGFAKAYVESRDYRPMVLTLPDSKYALVNSEGVIVFYEVKTGKGKWDGMQFLDRLVGAPGDWQRYPVKGQAKAQTMMLLNMDAKASAILFSKHFTICAVCGSPLSDPESVARGLGPICAERF